MRPLAVVGAVALAFGLASYYATEQLSPFSWINGIGGLLALAVSVVAGARRAKHLGNPTARRLLFPRALAVLAAVAVAVGLEGAAARTGWQLDWTAERRYELSPATCKLLGGLPGELSAVLYYELFDPRVRSTRLLLKTLGRCGSVRARSRLLKEATDEADRYGISSSNTVVLALGDRFEKVERPTEGTIYEALHRLVHTKPRTLYVARGEGEGSFTSLEDAGYSGLASALQTEGYRLHDLVTASVTQVPDAADAVLIVGPKRRLRDETLAALERYLERGGRLIAFLDPGPVTGLEPLLTRWGFGLDPGVVVDPASGPIEGDPPGVNPLVFHYADHPVTRGLGDTKMVFFLSAREVRAARKPRVNDELRGIAFTSRRAWVSTHVASVAQGRLPIRPDGARGSYRALVAAGRYPRGDRETRILVFGDSDLASNRHLRALYNLDLVMNAVHWTTQQEDEITLRPKALTPNQFPLTPNQSLQMFYGVGLLLPELCLLAGAVIWLRRRSA